MKAAVDTSYGTLDVVRIADVEKPSPRDDEVLIVHAASVNPLDCRLVKGDPAVLRLFLGLRKPRLGRPGVDVATT
jgi:NADPH:quinone reductase-like Zn-dependent oxidoreductase